MFIWIFWHLIAIRIRIRNHIFARSKRKWHSIAHAYIALQIRGIAGRDAKKSISRNWIMSICCQVETSIYKVLHIFVRFRCIFSAISLLYTLAFCLPWQWVNAQWPECGTPNIFYVPKTYIVYKNTHLYTCIYTYTIIHAYIHVHLHVHVHAYVHEHIHAHIHAHCMHIYINMYITLTYIHILLQLDGELFSCNAFITSELVTGIG